MDSNHIQSSVERLETVLFTCLKMRCKVCLEKSLFSLQLSKTSRIKYKNPPPSCVGILYAHHICRDTETTVSYVARPMQVILRIRVTVASILAQFCASDYSLSRSCEPLLWIRVTIHGWRTIIVEQDFRDADSQHSGSFGTYLICRRAGRTATCG